jgi:hypothetical protein
MTVGGSLSLEPLSRGSLQELDVWLVGSAELMRATSRVCRVAGPGPDDEWKALLRSHAPDFLLVEGVESLPAPWVGRLDGLLAACEELATPSFLWITASPCDPAFLRICPRFTRTFSVDRDQRTLLLRAGARAPSLLWPGTSIPIATEQAPKGTESGRTRVVWLGGWRREWPAAWRARLLAILDAAHPHGLWIAGPVEPGELPASLQGCVDPASPLDAEAALRRARVTIAADGTSAAPQLAPRVAFDAMACGSAVVTPHAFAAIFDFSRGTWGSNSWRSLAPVVSDHETAATEIDRLLANEERLDEDTQLCRRIVRFNHTHAHRIATLASAAGIHVPPNAAPNTAHR